MMGFVLPAGQPIQLLHDDDVVQVAQSGEGAAGRGDKAKVKAKTKAKAKAKSALTLSLKDNPKRAKQSGAHSTQTLMAADELVSYARGRVLGAEPTPSVKVSRKRASLKKRADGTHEAAPAAKVRAATIHGVTSGARA